MKNKYPEENYFVMWAKNESHVSRADATIDLASRKANPEPIVARWPLYGGRFRYKVATIGDLIAVPAHTWRTSDGHGVESKAYVTIRPNGSNQYYTKNLRRCPDRYALQISDIESEIVRLRKKAEAIREEAFVAGKNLTFEMALKSTKDRKAARS